MEAVEENARPVIDVEALRDWGSFVAHALRRHFFVAGALFAAAAGGAMAWPSLAGRTWHVQATLLAQRNQIMPALGNPQRAIPHEADAPTRAASELIMRRSNLTALINQTRLLESLRESRAPLARLKDRVMERVRGPLTAEEQMDALIGVLEKRLWVRADEGTVTIAIDWPDPLAAHQVVEAAQQNFLEARHVAEVSTIVEAISILEGHAAEVRQSILTAISDLEKMQPRPRRPAAPAVERQRPTDDDKRAQLLVLLNARRRAIADLEEFRRRRLGELHAQLEQERGSYQEVHPIVVDLKQTIASLEHASPQVEALRKEEAAIAIEYQAAGGKLPPEDPGGRLAPSTPPEAVAIASRQVELEDPAYEYARAGMRFAVSKYESLLDRIDSARIELDTARAAFKYRYSVVRPSQVPKKPSQPRMKLLVAGGLFCGVLLALLAAAGLDLASGRIVERWQPQRSLGLDLLGAVEAP